MSNLDIISEKIYNHFNNKYPSFFSSLNLSKSQIKQILKSKQNKLHDKSYVSKVIETLDQNIQTKLHSNHANAGYAKFGNTQPNSAKQIMPVISYVQDTNTTMPYNNFLNNFKYDEKPKEITGNPEKVDNSKAFQQILKDRGQEFPEPLPSKSSNITNVVNNFQNDEEDKDDNIASDNHQRKTEIKTENIEQQFQELSEKLPESVKQSVKDMVEPEEVTKSFYIGIDSKDRDTALFSKPNEYSIKFSPSNTTSSGYIDSGFQNIISIELIEGILADSSSETNASDNGTSFPYLLLQIEEFGGLFEGTNDVMTKSFAILKNFTTQNGFKYYKLVGDTMTNEGIIKVFEPRISLSKMTVRVMTPDGTAFNFGDGNDSNATTVNYFLFKVKTAQKRLTTQFMEQGTF